MNETIITVAICQAPTLSNSTDFPSYFENDVTLADPAPSWHHGMKIMGLEQTPENCKRYGTCGEVRRTYKHEHYWEDGAIEKCNGHWCPSARIRNAYERCFMLSRWEKRFYTIIGAGRYSALRDRLTENGIPFYAFPRPNGNLLVLTPEEIEGSASYFGGWCHIYLLYYQIPEGARLRCSYAKSAGAPPPLDTPGAEVNDSSAEPEAHENTELCGLPLKPEASTYMIHNWGVPERVFYLHQQGFRLGCGTRGGVRVYFGSEAESDRIAEVLSDMAHTPPEIVHHIRGEVMQELRNPTPATWKNLVREIQKCDREVWETGK